MTKDLQLDDKTPAEKPNEQRLADLARPAAERESGLRRGITDRETR